MVIGAVAIKKLTSISHTPYNNYIEYIAPLLV